MAMLVKMSGALPVFVRVTVLGALVVEIGWAAKAPGVERFTTGAGAAVPLPVRGTLWGLPAASSVTLSVPVRVPVAVGLNVTLMVHLAAAARGDTHVLI